MLKHQSAFTIFPVTLILVVIVFSFSLSVSFLQTLRIKQNNLAIIYQQTETKAATNLDSFYIALNYEPNLFTNVTGCPYIMGVDYLHLNAEIKANYQLNDEFYLCEITHERFQMAVRIEHDIGIRDVLLTRKIKLISGVMSWESDSMVDF